MLKNVVRDVGEVMWGPVEQSSEEGRAELLRNISRVNLFCMVGGLPGVAFNAWLLWPEVPAFPLLIWSCAHAILIAALIVRDISVLSQPDVASCLAAEPIMRVSAVAFGASVGASALLGVAGTAASQGFVINVIIVGLWVNVVVNAGVWELFWRGQIPLAVLSLSAFLFGGRAGGVRQVLLILVMVGFSSAVAAILHRYLRRSMSLHLANTKLVADLVAANERLAEDARTDGLTGLLNRGGFVSKLEAMMSDGPLLVRDGDPRPEQIGVMFLDLDRFKAINDSFGHATGDEVLVRTAERLQSQVRPTDIVARIGGDEFTVAALGIGSMAEARGLADRVYRAFELPIEIDGIEHQLGASIGVSFGSLASLDLDELIASADHALYQAKRSPAVGVEVFDDQARSQLRARRKKQDDVAKALEVGQIRPYWQPIVRVDDGGLHGLEGLARWEVDGEVHTAGSFISELLEAGLEDELAKTMLTATLDTRRAIDPEVPLGLNITPSQIERVLNPLLASESLVGLTIEITEQGILNNLKAAQVAVAEARSRGCRVFLDDFGTGYSSLSLIADLPLDGIKIDGRFMASIDDPESFNIVADVSEIGRRHGLLVIAEGVETPGQLDVCRMLGVPLVQGFLVSHPMSTADLKAMQAGKSLPWKSLFEDQMDSSTTRT